MGEGAVKRIVDAAISHPVVTGVFALLVVSLGFFSLFNLSVELDPRVDIPVVIVVVPYPGASPEEVESGIAVELETSLNRIDNVDFVASTCVEGAYASAVRFVDNVDTDRALQDVRDAVSEAEPEFPGDAEEALVNDVSFADIPLMLISLSGEKDLLRLQGIAEDLADELEGVYGVSMVELYGGLEREVEVRADRRRLASYGLTLSEVVEAVRMNHVNLPGGELSPDGGGKILIRTLGEAEAVRKLEAIALPASGMGMIRLRDVATVGFGAETRRSISRLNGDAAVTLIVQRRSNINTLRTVDEIEEKLRTARETGILPAHIKVHFTNNQAEAIRLLLGQLLSSAAYGAALVVGLLFLFMGSRNSILITIAIPFSLLFAFTCQFLTDLEISKMTMFSSILILGMVVDGAIIVGESIYRQLEYGSSPLKAARDGVHEVGWPVIAADLTTISVFFPMIFMRGVMGQHMAIMPKIVTYTLFGSILVDHFILPTAAAKAMKPDKAHPRFRFAGFMVIVGALCIFMPRTERVISLAVMALLAFDVFLLPLLTGGRWKGWSLDLINHRTGEESCNPPESHHFTLGPLSRMYQALLVFSLKRRWSIIVLGGLLFLIAVGLVAGGALGNEFFPETDTGMFLMYVQMPPGTTVEETADACCEIETMLSQIPSGELDSFVLNAGQATGAVWRSSDAGPTSGPEFAEITVDLTDEFERRTHTPPFRMLFEIKEHLRTQLDGKLPGAKIRFEQTWGGPPVGREVVVRCYSENLDALSRYAGALETMMKKVPGAIDVGNSFFAGRPEYKVSIRRDDAARWGVSTGAAARTVMDAFLGREAADFTERGENYDIRVQLDEADQVSLEDLLLLEIPGRNGAVPLIEVADAELSDGLSHIQRRNQKRLINVFCDADRSAGFDVDDVRKAVQACLKANPPPRNITCSIHGENDEQEKSMADLKRAFFFGIVLIFFILTVQFNSFRQPMVVLLAVPMALVGAVLGLYLTGVKFGFMATVGVVALVGIVVNDNIVLVDYCNQLRRSGMRRDEALVQAGLRRLRPILLTTVTTLGGLLPLTLDWGGGGAFWLPLGVTIIFGLGLDSLLTLVLVPVIYSVFESPGPLPPRGREGEESDVDHAGGPAQV